MTSTLALRRRAEVEAKLKSLDEEIAHWTKVTEEAERGLRRHYSQVRRLAAVFAGLTESVKAAIAIPSDDPEAVFESAEDWENEILAAHAVWEVFRSKLVLREDESFRDRLAACDDLAWACYAPAMRHFSGVRKEPPLVYFTATWSAFAVSRDSSFENEVRASHGSAAALGDDGFQDVLAKLPIPLIGVPWYHVSHLPGAIAIAHEAGHVVESDFDLKAAIKLALDGARLDHPQLWEGWASEVFADLYGCLCMGPAYVAVVMDLLSTRREDIRTEERWSGRYPSRALRVEILLAALDACGHGAQIKRLRAIWEEAYGPMQTMLSVRDDVGRAVPALYAGPYQGRALSEIVSPFPADAAGLVEELGEKAAGNYGELEPDVRLLFAAAQWVHEHAAPSQAGEAYQRIVTRLVQPGATEFRMRGAPVADKVSVEADLKLLEEADKQNGRELNAMRLRLTAAAKASAEPPDPPES